MYANYAKLFDFPAENKRSHYKKTEGVTLTTTISITERQLNILHHLERSKDWISSKELGDLLGVSNKTIQNELTALQSFFPEGWEIIASRGIGVRLIRPMDQSILSTFTNRDIQLLYDLILLIAANEVDTLHDVSDTLYISTSYAHTLIKKLKKRVSVHQITLEERPYRLVGEEGFIRALLFKVYLAQNGTMTYQRFIEDDRELLYRVLHDEVGIEQSVYGLNTFYDYIQISLERIRAGHHAKDIPQDLLERTEVKSFAKRITPLFVFLEEHYAIKLSQNERFYIYYALVHSEFYFTESMKPAFLQSLADANHEWHDFYLFTHYIEACTNLNLKEDTLLVSGAFTTYFLSKHRSALSIKEVDHLELFDYVIEKDNLPLKQFTALCQSWAKHFHFLFTSRTSIALLILIQQFVQKNTKVRALFIKSRSVAISHYVATSIDRELSGKLCLQPILAQDAKNIDITLMEGKFDFIITDVLLPQQPTCPVILIDTILSTTTFAKIAELTETIKRQKEAIIINQLPVAPYLKKS